MGRRGIWGNPRTFVFGHLLAALIFCAGGGVSATPARADTLDQHSDFLGSTPITDDTSQSLLKELDDDKVLLQSRGVVFTPVDGAATIAASPFIRCSVPLNTRPRAIE